MAGTFSITDAHAQLDKSSQRNVSRCTSITGGGASIWRLSDKQRSVHIPGVELNWTDACTHTSLSRAVSFRKKDGDVIRVAVANDGESCIDVFGVVDGEVCKVDSIGIDLRREEGILDVGVRDEMILFCVTSLGRVWEII